jgi:hypothetical protein
MSLASAQPRASSTEGAPPMIPRGSTLPPGVWLTPDPLSQLPQQSGRADARHAAEQHHLT